MNTVETKFALWDWTSQSGVDKNSIVLGLNAVSIG